MQGNATDPASTFPLARYRLEWRASTPLRLPDYAGSMLRGAFGHALRKLACMTKQKGCAGCPLLSNCPYPAIFAPPPPARHSLQKFSQIPVPYIIEPPDWGARQLGEGEAFAFHIVLVGRALRELPLIILAWRRAFARGVGAGDGTAELLRVVHCDEAQETEIHRPDTGTLVPHAQAIAFNSANNSEAAPRELTLHFLTPLRLQKNGRALPPEKLDARTLLMALVRRANLLAEFHTSGPLVEDFRSLLAASARVQDDKHLVWQDWTRFSSRQRQKMALGGAVGEWTISGALDPFIPFLELGEWIHVGKEAAFGLGHYALCTPGKPHTYAVNTEVRDRARQRIGAKEKIARDRFV
jgi:hypothetical protein